MLIREEDARTLAMLGFTNSQAKVYLTLVTLRKSNGKTLWKHSGVARQDIYRILNELQEKGLIEKTIAAKPTEYKAIPIEDGLSSLLLRKALEYKKAEEKTSMLIKKLKDMRITKPDEENQFCLVPSKEASLAKRKKCMKSALFSTDVITSWKRFLQLASTQMDDLSEAHERGVRYRWMIARPKHTDKVPEIIRDYMCGSSCKFKYAFFVSTETAVAIYDGKEVLVATDAEKTFYLDSPMLWSNNSSFVTIMKHYFDSLWKAAAATPVALTLIIGLTLIPT